MSILDSHLDAAFGPRGQKPLDYALDTAFGKPAALSDPSGPLSKDPRLRRMQIQQRSAVESADAGMLDSQSKRDLLAAAGGAAAGLLIPGGPAVTLGKGVMGALPGLAARAGMGALGGGAAAGVEAGISGDEVLPAVGRGAAFGAPAGAIMGAVSPLLARKANVAERFAGKVSRETSEASGLLTPVDRVSQAVREAPALEPIQKRLYRVERGKRVGLAKEAASGLKGEAAVSATLGQMKGELPKVGFESLRGKINEEDVTALIEQARNHPGLGFFESQITAPLALQKMFDGKLPTKGEISLLDDIFGEKLTSALLSKRSTLAKAVDLGIQVANVPREIMSSFDLSAPFRQGAFLVGKPKQFGSAFASMFKYLGSERSVKALDDYIATRPNAVLGRESGLATTQTGAVLGKREEAFAGGLAQKIPILGHGIRASERAYTGFLNKLRADVFDDLVSKAQKLGRDPREVGKDIASFVNSATGRGELPGALEKSATALNAVFFSPRFMASRVNLLNPLYYAKLDPFVRKEAIRALLTSGSVAASIMGVAKMGGAEVATDPRDSDFGKFRVDDTRFDMLAGFGQWIRLGARVATQDGKIGEVGRFFRYKESPIAALAHNILAGQTSLGEEVTLPSEAKRMLLPMIMQDVRDAYDEWGAPGLGVSAPAAFGIGVQTY